MSETSSVQVDRSDRQAFQTAAARALELSERFCARRRLFSTVPGWKRPRQTLPQVFPPGFARSKMRFGTFPAGKPRGEIGFG